MALGAVRTSMPAWRSSSTLAPVASTPTGARNGLLQPRTRMASEPSGSVRISSTTPWRKTAPEATAWRAIRASRMRRLMVTYWPGMGTSNFEGLNTVASENWLPWSRISGSRRKRSRTFRESGIRASPQVLSRGNFWPSSSSTRRPQRARWAAAILPAGPAPTTIMSHSSEGSPATGGCQPHSDTKSSALAITGSETSLAARVGHR